MRQKRHCSILAHAPLCMSGNVHTQSADVIESRPESSHSSWLPTVFTRPGTTMLTRILCGEYVLAADRVIPARCMWVLAPPLHIQYSTCMAGLMPNLPVVFRRAALWQALYHTCNSAFGCCHDVMVCIALVCNGTAIEDYGTTSTFHHWPNLHSRHDITAGGQLQQGRIMQPCGIAFHARSGQLTDALSMLKAEKVFLAMAS